MPCTPITLLTSITARRKSPETGRLSTEKAGSRSRFSLLPPTGASNHRRLSPHGGLSIVHSLLRSFVMHSPNIPSDTGRRPCVLLSINTHPAGQSHVQCSHVTASTSRRTRFAPQATSAQWINQTWRGYTARGGHFNVSGCACQFGLWVLSIHTLARPRRHTCWA